MVSRRDVLAGGVMVGASWMFGCRAASLAALPDESREGFRPPAGSCDCAVHVFDPARFPYTPGRNYTPEPATRERLRQHLQSLGLDRVIVVQATVNGTDNSPMVDAVRWLGERARGVAMIDDATTDAALDEMHAAGVRGIRLGLSNLGITDPVEARRRLQVGAERARIRGWHLQVTAQPPTIEALGRDLMALPVPLVIDHFGEIRAAQGLNQPGFGTVVDLVRAGRAYVKISNADSLSAREDMTDMAPFAQALVSANPRRILWGSGWPHPNAGAVPGRLPTDLSPNRRTDVQDVLNLLPVWVPSSATRQMILVENPARLYAF